MSIVAAPVANHSAVKPYQSICYYDNVVTSQGFFLGENPLSFALPVLLLEIPFIFIVSSAVHFLLRPFRQSRIVSQILTGILIGRSVAGRAFGKILFPTRSTFILDNICLVSLILFLFSVGVKTDLRILRKPGRRAVAIGIAGSVLPFVLALTTSFLTRSSLPADFSGEGFAFELVLRLSLPSFPVLSDALDEFGLLNSDLGRLSLSATLISDVLSWALIAGIDAWGLVVKANSPVTAVAIVMSLVVLLVVAIFVAPPAARWLIKCTPPGDLLHAASFISLILAALAAAFFTDISGYHSTLGPFVLGLAIPSGMPIGVSLRQKLDPFLSGLFLPLFLVIAGCRTDFSKIKSFTTWGYVELIFVVCYLSKLVGCTAAAKIFGIPIRDALTVGLMMNVKGIVEVSAFNNWADAELAGAHVFTLLMLSLLLNTAATTPLIKSIYDPSARYSSAGRKRRTIQHSKPGSELSVLVCIHNEDNVAPFLDLLEASGPSDDSPMNVTVIHLTELAGQAASFLRPHKRRRGANPSSTDRIANAFRYFEQQSGGAASVRTYAAAAPPATMYNDVCSLALDKRARIILLPFHKQSDGARETGRNAVQSMNRSVLACAPCSVAILIDRGLPGGATCSHTNHLLQRVAVYFIGGADDREALAYGMRMARGGKVALMVVRLVRRGGGEEGRGRKMDDEVVAAFRERCGEMRGVLYEERVVADGEGTVAIIRSMSGRFDLLIVGRRKGEEEELTSGMSEWSECPELGLVGDMLAATDLGGNVSILVVQQQERLMPPESSGGGAAAAGGDRLMVTPSPPPHEEEEMKDGGVEN